jgi:Holliday junction resolvase YEN1
MVFSSAPCRRGVDDDSSTRESDAILYKAEDIESHPQLGFTSADFVFIALICGSAYSVCPSVFDSLVI